MNKITAEAAKITISEKTVFIITFLRSIISQIPNMATIVNTITKVIRVYDTDFLKISILRFFNL